MPAALGVAAALLLLLLLLALLAAAGAGAAVVTAALLRAACCVAAPSPASTAAAPADPAVNAASLPTAGAAAGALQALLLPVPASLLSLLLLDISAAATGPHLQRKSCAPASSGTYVSSLAICNQQLKRYELAGNSDVAWEQRDSCPLAIRDVQKGGNRQQPRTTLLLTLLQQC
jgi:hypothetical protein